MLHSHLAKLTLVSAHDYHPCLWSQRPARALSTSHIRASELRITMSLFVPKENHPNRVWTTSCRSLMAAAIF